MIQIEQVPGRGWGSIKLVVVIVSLCLVIEIGLFIRISIIVVVITREGMKTVITHAIIMTGKSAEGISSIGSKKRTIFDS